MDEGPVALVLRKFDLSREADEGEDACDVVFEFPRGFVDSAPDSQGLFRYSISLDTLHRDVCRESPSPCRVVAGGSRKTEIHVAFRRVENTDDLLVFACPTPGSPSQFKVLSELVFTILCACGLGPSPATQFGDFGAFAPSPADWLAALLGERGSDPPRTPAQIVAGAAKAGDALAFRNIVVRRLLESTCSSLYLTALDLQFTVLSKREGREYRVLYADDPREIHLPWLVATCRPESGEASPGPSVIHVKSEVAFGRRAETEQNAAEERDAFVSASRSRGLCVCVKCTSRSPSGGIVTAANWPWLVDGVRKLAERVLSDFGESIRGRSGDAGGGGAAYYLGKEIFSSSSALTV